MTDHHCVNCQKVNGTELECDGCHSWWCADCVNRTELVLTDLLYQALTAKGEFPWQCETCSTDGLYRQMLQSGTFLKDELINLDCNLTLVDEATKATGGSDAELNRLPVDTDANQPGTSANEGQPNQVFNHDQSIPDATAMDATTRMFMACQQQQMQSQSQQNQFMQQMMQFQQQTQQSLIQTQQQMATLVQNINSLQIGQNANQTTSQPNSNTTQQDQVFQSVTTLPRIQLSTFDGDLLKWHNFWESFEINVHSQRLHDKQKLDYLHQLLKGAAYDKIKGLGLEGSNYAEAVAILKQHYSNPMFQKKAQWDAFHGLPTVRDNLSNLEKFTDEARAVTNCIVRQGTTKDALDVLLPELIKKLPAHLLTEMNKMRLWQQRTQQDVTMDELLEFLRQYNEIQTLSAGQARSQPPEKQPVANFKASYAMKPLHTANFNQTINSTQSFRGCVFCQRENHYSDDCNKVSKVSERKQLLIKERRCFKCLANTHQFKDCTRTKGCFHCKQSGHHSSLCTKRSMRQHETQLSQQMEINDDNVGWNESIAHHTRAPNTTINASINVAASKTTEGIVMAAFPCKVVNPATKQTEWLFVYADGGAKVTCISEAAAHKLNLKPRKSVSLAVSRFNADQVDVIKANVVKAQLKGLNGFKLNIEAYSVSKTAPAFKVGPIKLNMDGLKKVRELNPINRPPQNEVEHPIDILIGQDYYNAILGPKTATTNVQHQLYVFHSQLGNVLCGNSTQSSKCGGDQSMCLLNQATVRDPMEHLWKLESIGISSPDQATTPKNQRVLQEFNDAVRFKNNRYEVGFPWKSPSTHLASNYQVAKGRLESTLRTLAPNQKPTDNFNVYNAVIQDQLNNGVIEKVEAKEMDGPVKHYIAHFPVIKKECSTTKVRIVYDASAKTKHENKSLNDMIHIGPCLLNDLAGILLRFRTYTIAMTADIEKAFLQVGLRLEDRDCTRFLWLKDASKPNTDNNIQVLRFTRIPFGIGSSPFLLGATVKFHLEKQQTDVGQAISRNLYVDNAILDAEGTSEALAKYRKSKDLFSLASMNLREWTSNDIDFNNAVPMEDRSKSTIVKVLGMIWNTGSDHIHVKEPAEELRKPMETKREVVQQVAKWFDPLGLVSPVLVNAKVFIQQLWKLNLGWDDFLPAVQQKEWNFLKSQFSDIGNLEIPRMIVINRKHAVQLCCFTDSSEMAYATCIYARQQVGDQVTSRLIFAKTRVSPIKPKLTIPRLELTAVVIGCRALKFVAEECGLQVEGWFLWSDSQIALHWIHSSKDLQPYVERRRQEIVKNPITFGYVDTKSNPADLGTRGCTTNQLRESSWFEGPKWLKLPSNQWPNWSEQCLTTPQMVQTSEKIHMVAGNAPNVNPEVGNENFLQPEVDRKCSEMVQIIQKQPEMDPEVKSDGKTQPEMDRKWMNFIDNKPDLQSVARILAYCFRFINSARKRSIPATIALTTAEIHHAKLQIVKLDQAENYSEEFKLLHRGKNNQLIKQLDLSVKNGILRCGGRLGNAFPEETASPILLSKNSKVTQLIIMDAHEKMFHYGIKATLAEVRKRYWLPQGYTQVRRILRNCIICRRVQGGTFKPPRMAALPAERVQRSPAFKFTGLDYLGPLLVREGPGHEHEKRWIAIFTCFTTRAIHLELINDCSTEAATQAILRFIGRRGTPHTLLTDNATQFKKGAQVMKAIWQNQPTIDAVENLTKFFSQQQINWKFIPEGSPWVGGFYERLVDLVKRALRKLFWKTTIKADTLATVLAQLEGVLNTRPLLATDSDYNECLTLTPANFIAPSSQLSAPPSDEDREDPDYTPDPRAQQSLLKQWKFIETKLDQFWKIWQSQYLQELRQVHQTHFKLQKGNVDRVPSKGEVCLIKEHSPRATWKMARIIDLIHGQDQEVRFATLRLPSGHITRRGIKDLVPLEAEFPEETQSETSLITPRMPRGDCRDTTI